MLRISTLVTTLAGLAGTLAAACSGGGSDTCSPGTEGCVCVQPGGCVTGLVCESNQCVQPGSGPDTDTGAATMTGTGVTSGGSGSSGAGSLGPEIVSFETNVSSITEGGFVVFSAQVTDADGVDDIVGVVLTMEDGSAAYGELTGDGAGAFQLGLSWDEIHAVDPINFDQAIVRPFRVTVTDSMDQTATETTELTITCSAVDACEGRCVDILIDDANCGACGHTCTLGAGLGGCTAGACQSTFYDCFEPQDASTCDEYCMAQGVTCDAAACVTSTYVLYDDMQSCTDFMATVAQGTACNAPIDFMLKPFARCCCTG